jgi:DNA repair protein SbcD/Mre11
MRILHTADIHLQNPNDDRWNALVQVLHLAKEHRVDLMVISGDLFDRDLNAEQLRPHIRDVFSNNGFPVLIIPGNHDAGLIGDMYFGSDAVLMNDLYTPYDAGDVLVWGMPYEAVSSRVVLEKLQGLHGKLAEGKQHILLYHGELLDVMFTQSDFGGESGTGYMPVRLAYFQNLPISYVLAGHFHTRFDVRKLPQGGLSQGGYFIYPGSPVSITRRETGRRKVNIFEVGKPPGEVLLDTPHYESVAVRLDPSSPEDPADIVSGQLYSLHPAARVMLTVEGFMNRELLGATEQEVVERIDAVARERCLTIEYTFRDVGQILSDDLYVSFGKKLSVAGFDAERTGRIRNLVIQAMTEVKR